MVIFRDLFLRFKQDRLLLWDIVMPLFEMCTAVFFPLSLNTFWALKYMYPLHFALKTQTWIDPSIPLIFKILSRTWSAMSVSASLQSSSPKSRLIPNLCKSLFQNNWIIWNKRPDYWSILLFNAIYCWHMSTDKKAYLLTFYNIFNTQNFTHFNFLML